MEDLPSSCGGITRRQNTRVRVIRMSLGEGTYEGGFVYLDNEILQIAKIWRRWGDLSSSNAEGAISSDPG